MQQPINRGSYSTAFGPVPQHPFLSLITLPPQHFSLLDAYRPSTNKTYFLRRNSYQMNSIQCNIFHHQVAGTLSLDIWDQMMVHCHQHDCSIEFRPLLAVLLLLHNIEIDFLDTDHHRSIFALVGIKNRGIFQIKLNKNKTKIWLQSCW